MAFLFIMPMCMILHLALLLFHKSDNPSREKKRQCTYDGNNRPDNEANKAIYAGIKLLAIWCARYVKRGKSVERANEIDDTNNNSDCKNQPTYKFHNSTRLLKSFKGYVHSPCKFKNCKFIQIPSMICKNQLCFTA